MHYNIKSDARGVGYNWCARCTIDIHVLGFSAKSAKLCKSATEKRAPNKHLTFGRDP